MSFIVAVHIPIAGLGLLPVLLGWPLLFFPLHVLFLEFVIDPACAFVFEADAEASRHHAAQAAATRCSAVLQIHPDAQHDPGRVALLFSIVVYGIALSY